MSTAGGTPIRMTRDDRFPRDSKEPDPFTIICHAFVRLFYFYFQLALSVYGSWSRVLCDKLPEFNTPITTQHTIISYL